ncbi:2,3-bisphosphoglycerate-independent phosphoglycerate mutase [Litoribacillus peritrichatus]|uniref:2,3-bisphosphoglycerate-independent phosphoglycerate mutase n=1 Tax=Litoribacillus peritrichatus TaxID=718191 RepID=A0ABP7MSD8_9GAMM
MTKQTTALIILDGFGHRVEEDNNAILNAKTPVWDRLIKEQPNTLINTSGMAVGLPEGQMGNSEVGHMNLGAGRIVYQNFTLITKAIETKTFFDNTALCNAVDTANKHNGVVHILGLLSPGGIHSHEDQLKAMVELADQRGAKEIYVHAFLDGRDMPPRSAEPSIQAMDKLLAETGKGRVASLVGRYYAMDRDNRWDRVEAAYKLLTEGKGEFQSDNGVAGLAAAYKRDENDEFVKTTVCASGEQTAATIQDGDSVIFMNFRADRARELTRAFIEDDFSGFERAVRPKLADFVMLTEFAADIKTSCAYPPAELKNSLGEFVSAQGMTQLRIAETEKYAHVTFFFSGGQEAEFEGETRILVQSPDVATYDLQPEMNAPEVTDKLVEAIKSGKYDLVICNYANGDMVGHTGKYDAAVKAVEALDVCIERVTNAILEVNGHCLITADHGNCEQMQDYESGQAHTQHTTGPVPLVYVGNNAELTLKDDGALCDIAPSLLSLMGQQPPAEMTGKSLVQK